MFQRILFAKMVQRGRGSCCIRSKFSFGIKMGCLETKVRFSSTWNDLSQSNNNEIFLTLRLNKMFSRCRTGKYFASSKSSGKKPKARLTLVAYFKIDYSSNQWKLFSVSLPVDAGFTKHDEQIIDLLISKKWWCFKELVPFILSKYYKLIVQQHTSTKL